MSGRYHCGMTGMCVDCGATAHADEYYCDLCFEAACPPIEIVLTPEQAATIDRIIADDSPSAPALVALFADEARS